MKILAINNTKFTAQDNKKNVGLQTISINNSNDKSLGNFVLGSSTLGVYNKAFINFKGYSGDLAPAKRLFWLLAGTDEIQVSEFAKQNLFKSGNTGWKKWVNISPEDLLKKSAKEAIEMICTLNNTREIPSHIPTPNYGDRWGRRANYIEINPRTIAYTQGDKKDEGLLNLIKLMPAIPPSPDRFANCVILSQLYPSMHNDGRIGNASLYSINLLSGISKNLTSEKLYRNGEKMKDVELVKAFNDLAHFRGLKTGMRMPLSAGQIQVEGRPFDWYNHEKAFIDSCVDAVDMGFDAIYFDSAKHIGGYDMGNYCGEGALPNFKQMQYITSQIRERTGRNDISLIGEKCNNDPRYKDMGLTAGTDWGGADSREHVLHEYKNQKYTDEYAAGPDVSNDNDNGSMSFEQRRNRIHNAINGYEDTNFKLPAYMQMSDIFPLTPYSNTHEEMLISTNRSAFGDSDIESNYNNIFNTSDSAKNYKQGVYDEFLNVLYSA